MLVIGFNFHLQRGARNGQSIGEGDPSHTQNGNDNEAEIVDERFQKAVVDFQPVGQSSRLHQTHVEPHF